MPRAPLTWKPPLNKWTSRSRRTPPFMGSAGNWRFSPGYGDCPLSAQRSIVNSVLNATRLIGLTVTPTSLLIPTKSVTAVIGLFDGEVHDAQAAHLQYLPHARALPLPRRPHHLLFQPLGALDVSLR